MEENSFHVLIGIIFSIFIGLVGVMLSKRKTKINEIFFIEKECFALLRRVLGEFEEIEFLYKGRTIQENLILYKVAFCNFGDFDVDQNMIHGNLKMLLPKDYVWRHVVISDKSDELNVQPIFNSRELSFGWDIFKRTEYFIIDCIIEYLPENETKIDSEKIVETLTDNVVVEHRITNLQPVLRRHIQKNSYNWYKYLGLSVVILGMLIFSVNQTYNIQYETKYNQYREIKYHDKIEYVRIGFEGNHLVLRDSLRNSLYLFNSSPKGIKDSILFTGRSKLIREPKDVFGVIFGSILSMLLGLIFIRVVKELLEYNEDEKALNKSIDAVLL